MTDLPERLSELAEAVEACEWELPIDAKETLNEAAEALEIRYLEVVMDRCAECNHELSYCGRGGHDGPELDCRVCKQQAEIIALREQLEAAGDGDTWKAACKRLEGEVERLRPLVQCCERDHNLDGDCHIHPRGLRGEIDRLQGESRALREQLIEQTKSFCTHCGRLFPKGKEGVAQFREHIAECNKHPLHPMAAELADAKVRNRTSLEVIASREQHVEAQRVEIEQLRTDNALLRDLLREREVISCLIDGSEEYDARMWAWRKAAKQAGGDS